MKEKEKQVASREAAVSRKEREQAAKDEAQKEKDEAQAAKDKELAKRPPRTVVTTVTPVAKFAGFSVTETVNLGKMIEELGKSKVVHNTLIASKRQSYVTRNVSPTKLPNVVPSIQDGKLIYKFDFHNVGALVDASFYRYFGNHLTAYSKSFSFNQNSYTATKLDIGLGEKFDASTLVTEVDTSGNNGVNNARIHAEVVTDYSSDNTTDWVTWGSWIQVPKDSLALDKYSVGTFAMPGVKYGSIPVQATGSATYKGALLGFHTTLDSNEVKVSRFTGKATFTANFADAANAGTVGYMFNDFKLNGESVTGQFSANAIPFSFRGQNLAIKHFSMSSSRTTIDGSKFSGIGIMVYTGPQTNNTTKPTGFIGQVKGSSSDGMSHFAASFGAKKTE